VELLEASPDCREEFKPQPGWWPSRMATPGGGFWAFSQGERRPAGGERGSPSRIADCDRMMSLAESISNPRSQKPSEPSIAWCAKNGSRTLLGTTSVTTRTIRSDSRRCSRASWPRLIPRRQSKGEGRRNRGEGVSEGCWGETQHHHPGSPHNQHHSELCCCDDRSRYRTRTLTI